MVLFQIPNRELNAEEPDTELEPLQIEKREWNLKRNIISIDFYKPDSSDSSGPASINNTFHDSISDSLDAITAPTKQYFDFKK